MEHPRDCAMASSRLTCSASMEHFTCGLRPPVDGLPGRRFLCMASTVARPEYSAQDLKILPNTLDAMH